MEQNFDEFTCATRADGGQGRHRKTYKTGLQASGKPTKTAPWRLFPNPGVDWLQFSE